MASVFEQIVDAIHVALNEPELPYALYRLAQKEHAALRRVVWIPVSFASQKLSLSNPRVTATEERHVVGEEQWQVECHITGDTFEDAEGLRERLLWAVKSVLATNSRPQGGVWVNQEEIEAQIMLGSVQKVIQRFSWTVNVLSPEIPQLANVSAETQVVLGPDDETGELVDTFTQTVPTP